MKLLTKDEILGAIDTSEHIDIDVPEWGGSVRIGLLTGAERDRYEDSLRGTKGEPNLVNFRAKLLAVCIKDTDGKPLFTAKDIGALGAKSGKILDKLTDVALALNGLKPDALATAEKNLTSEEEATSTSFSLGN